MNRIHTFSLAVIIGLVILSGCSPGNRYRDTVLQQIVTCADERNTGELLRYTRHADPDYRAAAVQAFGAVQDSAAVPALLNLLEQDKQAPVREAAAFALGQTQKAYVGELLVRAAVTEKDERVLKALLIAAGKCEQAGWLTAQAEEFARRFPAALAEGLFYAVRSGQPVQQELVPVLFSLLHSGDEEARFYAASALARGKVQLSGQEPVLSQLFTETSAIPTRMALLRSLGKTGTQVLPLFEQLLKNDPEYLIRLSVLRAVNSWPSDSAALIIRSGLADNNIHVRQVAAEWCLDHPGTLPAPELLDAARRETQPKTACWLMQSVLLKEGPATDSLSDALRKRYTTEQDEYVKGFILKALAADWRNLAFIEQETFSTPSILVREYGFEALLKIRSDKRFPVYMNDWKQQHPGREPLDRYMAHLIRKGIETDDVSLIALAAEFLRDTTLPARSPGSIPVPYVSLDFMHRALNRLRLPRDIESYGELLKTLRFYEGKPVTGSLKPEFNNPVDWELAERIPSDQRVEIHTSAGVIEVELWVNRAPATVAQFVRLTQEAFYDNKRLHRVVPGFVIQDGCPRGDGFGSTMETLRSEFDPEARFDEGVLGMASAGNDTESCQWFITHTRMPHLNGRYTAFGRVVKGMEAVHALTMGAEIESIRLKN